MTFLKAFCPKMNDDELNAVAKAYLVSFRTVPDKIFKEAIFAYVDNEEFFPPKPNQLKKYIKDYHDSKHDQELINRFTCSQCGERVSAIVEKRCFDCVGLGGVDRQARAELPESDMGNFVIEGRRQCQECGTIGQCIKEPKENGIWQCRNCYSGMNGKEIAGKFGELCRLMGQKGDPEENRKSESIDEVPF